MFPSFTNLQYDLSAPPHPTSSDPTLSPDSLTTHSAASGKVKTEKVVALTPYAGTKGKKGKKEPRSSKHSSCEQCRSKKTKCDKKEHCSSCRIRGDLCTWSGAFPSVPADPDNNTDSSYRAQAEIARLRTIVHHLASRLGVDPDNPFPSPSSYPPSPSSPIPHSSSNPRSSSDPRSSPEPQYSPSSTNISYARCSSPEPPPRQSIDSTPRHSIDTSASYDAPLSAFSFVAERGQSGYGQAGGWEVPRSVEWAGYGIGSAP